MNYYWTRTFALKSSFEIVRSTIVHSTVSRDLWVKVLPKYSNLRQKLEDAFKYYNDD